VRRNREGVAEDGMFRAILLALALLACSGPSPAQPPPPVAGPPTGVQAPAQSVVRAYGHFPYAEGTGLTAGVCQHGDPERTRLKPEAAAALSRMLEAARAEGVRLKPSSCFRSIESQRRLFNCSGGSGTGCANGRLASAERRATAVAPPGHSEHATGYAIDFFPSATDLSAGGGCATAAACTTTARFAQSRSGKWLAAHADDYGFEQSFFTGSTQGVMVEPWHYRFVGSAEAAGVFRAARTQFPPPKSGQMQSP
jgi:zinc D-Ala-D-Ala carboxypeptidase